MIHIYVKKFNYASYGISVIVNNLLKFSNSLGVMMDCVDSLDGISKDDAVVPYGPKESKELIDFGYNTNCCLLIDAISLGYLNKIKHYIKSRHVFHKDFLYSIYGYIRYSAYEKKIVKKYNKIILVSQTDIDYLQNKNNKDKFICLKNGINIPQIVSKKSKSEKFRIGILSSWASFQSNEENRWILKKYVPKYIATHSNVEFILAGRGKWIHEYSSIPGVKVVGEINSLDDFFSNVDVFLSSNPKGCGVLNRILDAIAYKTPIIGHEKSFSGFRGMEKGFVSFADYNSFCKAIDKVKEKDVQASLVSEAYKFAHDNFDWKTNYDNFIIQYIKPLA